MRFGRVFLLIFANFAFGHLSKQTLFLELANKYDRDYVSTESMLMRYNVFLDNYEKITRHNARNTSWQMGWNQFFDMTSSEFRDLYLRPIGDFPRNCTSMRPTGFAPSSIDWRDKGVIADIKDQGACGSCWAFATIGAFEAAHAINSGTLQTYSEQELVDCSIEYGNFGCGGGLMDSAYRYIEDNGICTEDDYPYSASDSTCKAKKCTHKKGTLSKCIDVPADKENKLAEIVAETGPVSIAVEADGWQLYSEGIFDDDCGENLDHGVVIIGYGSDDGKDYWLVRNSWGKTWGEKGYIRLIRGRNECGLSDYVSYPVV